MIENVVRLTHRATDLTFEAISVGGRRGDKTVDLALTGRDLLWSLVGGRLVRTGRRKRPNAHEPAQRDAAVAGASRVERQREG